MSAETDLAIAGAGYVGLTSAACFCEMGYRVRLIEEDPEIRAALWAGHCPACEPTLPQLLHKHMGDRLQLSDRLAEAARHVRALFVCMDAPSRNGSVPALRPLNSLLTDLKAEFIRPEAVAGSAPIVVLQNAIAPGTSRLVWESLGRRVAVVANPQFLARGSAVQSFFHPPRMVVGSPDEEAALAVVGLYRDVNAPLLLLNWEEAELVKYASDAARSMQAALTADVAALCAQHQVDPAEVLGALGLEP